MGTCAIFIYVCERVQCVHTSWKLHSVKERASLLFQPCVRAGMYQQHSRRSPGGTMMGRWVRKFPSPLCLLRESFVLVLYWLQLICLLHPIPTNLPAQCTDIRGLGSQSVPTACCSPVDVLTYIPGIPYGKWHQKMAKRLQVEPDEKIGDANSKKGHILHLENQMLMPAQEKTFTGGTLSWKERNVPSETLLYPFYRCSLVALTLRKPEVICKNAQVTALLIFSLVGNVDTMDVRCGCSHAVSLFLIGYVLKSCPRM